jgi:hypothetical protein
MNDTNSTTTVEPERVWKRRGLFAAAAALVAAVVARVSEQRMEAGSDGDVVLGTSNTTAGVTQVNCTSSGGTGLQAFCEGTDGLGLYGQGLAVGVYGLCNPGALDPNSAGVVGVASVGSLAGASAAGVWGFDINTSASTGVGVRGQSSQGLGVHGLIPSSSSANTIAIYAQNYSTYAGPGPGAGGFGVYGLSAKGHGLVGATATAGGAAVVGATNGVAGAFAGAFYGPMVVSGAFTVVGGAKSAAVPHPDGSHRRLYCVESPESWFEDFGQGHLENGCASVAIDPDFAAVVDLTDYHVFLTSYGRDVLFVTSQASDGFRVEAQDATSVARFSWRLVAKRNDIAAPRFETVTVPPEPTLPDIPAMAVAPPPPHIVLQGQ